MQPEIFWGLTGTAWTAIGAIATIALALATIGVAWVAGYQIAAARTEAAAARNEAKKTRTLEIVSKYDHDPVLDQALRNMARARDKGVLLTNARDYRVDILAVMNYLETIAIGVKQEVFIPEMVQDFMDHIAWFHIDELSQGGLREKIGVGPTGFEHIIELANGWRPKATTRFRDGGLHD
jgi:hypothetical protein